MEPYCVKTVLLNLVQEHQLQISSLTTDRSTSVKTAIRLISTICKIIIPINIIFKWIRIRNARWVSIYSSLLWYLAFHKGILFKFSNLTIIGHFLKHRQFWKIYGKPANWKVVQVIFELELLGGLWNCLGLTEWVPSITNMLWYSFSSSVGNKTKKRIKSSQHYPLVKTTTTMSKIFRKSPAPTWEDSVNTRPYIQPTLLPSEHRTHEMSAPWVRRGYPQ